MKKILIILLVLVLTSCTPKNKPAETTPVNTGYGVSRYFDKEAGVVCWIYYDYKAGGISCLPIGDTLLEMPNEN
jgi:hypothetical protein